MTQTPNIILLTIDALRVDHLSAYGYHRDTPTLDQLAKEWIDFPRAISVSSHTREAMPSLLTGYEPHRFAQRNYTQLPQSQTLAEKLREVGYTTGGFHSNPYISRVYGFNRGFDKFFDDLVIGRSRLFALAQKALERFIFNRSEYYARAPEINRRSIEWLDEQKDPIFLWNHYMDTHGPYHAPDKKYADRELSADEAESLYRRSWKYPDSISDKECKLLIDSYDDEIRYLDQQLGLFIKELRKRDLLENTLVIVTSDHGDAFGEDGYFTHPRRLHDSLIRVPLFINPPSNINKIIQKPTSILDIVPTILSYAGFVDNNLPGTPLKTPDGGFLERDGIVFSSATGEGENEHIRRFSVRDEHWKVRIDRDLESGQIIDEWSTQLDEVKDTNDKVRSEKTKRLKLLTDRLRKYSEERIPVENQEIDDNVDHNINDRLEALGYK